MLAADQTTESGIQEQRERVKVLKAKLAGLETPEARDLLQPGRRPGEEERLDSGRRRLGLRHRLRRPRSRAGLRPQRQRPGARHRGLLEHGRPDVQVHAARRGGQVRGGRETPAQEGPGHDGHELRQRLRGGVAMGSSDMHTLKAFLEAEAYDGPSLIIAYSHCIAHGYDLVNGLDQQKAAVQSGYWPLYRYNPDLVKLGKNPFQLDSKPPALPLEKYIYNETRYTMLKHSDPQAAKLLLQFAEEDVRNRWRVYQNMAAMPVNGAAKEVK